MSSITPDTRPKMSADVVKGLIASKGVPLKQMVILGIRGYYEDSMGRAGKNDRAMYDDAVFVVTTSGVVTGFNANCDPTAYRTGVANLKPGVWQYKRGIHGLSRPPSRQYWALVQAAEVTVIRDNKGEDTGWFGINIHRGGDETTSSLGCQTIPPDQWAAFKTLVYAQAAETIPYVLVTQAEVEAYIASKESQANYTITALNKAWKRVTNSASGRPSVPIRAFVELVAPHASVDWNDAPTLNGIVVPEWFMVGTEAWAPVREIVDILSKIDEFKLKLVLDGQKITIAKP